MSEKSAQIFAIYKYKTGLTHSKLAYLFSISQRSMIKYLQGSVVHPKVAYRIEQVTHGEIKAIDLIESQSPHWKKNLLKKS